MVYTEDKKTGFDVCNKKQLQLNLKICIFFYIQS